MGLIRLKHLTKCYFDVYNVRVLIDEHLWLSNEGWKPKFQNFWHVLEEEKEFLELFINSVCWVGSSFDK